MTRDRGLNNLLSVTKSKPLPKTKQTDNRGFSAHLVLAAEFLMHLENQRTPSREALVEAAHRLALCGFSTRQIGRALLETKHAGPWTKDDHPDWLVPSHVTIAAWLKEECHAAYA